MAIENKDFELALRKLIDEKYDRAPAADNPILQLIQGELPLAGCRDFYGGMFQSLMVFNRVLLPRLLSTAPSVPLRVELMGVIAQEYGPQLDDAHPVLFLNFLSSIGVETASYDWSFDLERGPCAQEVKLLRELSFVELLARILVGESLGPVVFPAVADALKRNYGLGDNAVAYFGIHAVTDKKDAELLFDLVRREARTEPQQRAVLKVVEDSFEFGRYRIYGCKLPGTTSYRYARKFDRRNAASA